MWKNQIHKTRATTFINPENPSLSLLITSRSTTFFFARMHTGVTEVVAVVIVMIFLVDVWIVFSSYNNCLKEVWKVVVIDADSNTIYFF